MRRCPTLYLAGADAALRVAVESGVHPLNWLLSAGRYWSGSKFKRGVAEKAAVSASAGVWKPGCMFKNPHFSFRQTHPGGAEGQAPPDPTRTRPEPRSGRPPRLPDPSAPLVRPELKGGKLPALKPQGDVRVAPKRSLEEVLFHVLHCGTDI